MTKSVVFSFRAPRQSWGTERTLSDPNTHEVPTFSAIIGMVANGMGRRRSEPIVDLSSLGFGIRVDTPGVASVDLQTQSWEKGKSKKSETMTKNTHFLADGGYTVALSSEDDDLILSVSDALTFPERPLYLGRTSFPHGSFEAVVVDGDATSALRDGKNRPVHRTAAFGEMPSYTVRDIPLSFDRGSRRYVNRHVRVEYS